MKKQINLSHPELRMKYNFHHSNHSLERINQRHILDNDIQVALNYTESFFKQGLVFHVVKDNLIPEDLPEKISIRIRNLVIIIAGDTSQIITCYRSKKALKNIKRKSCRLSRRITPMYKYTA